MIFRRLPCAIAAAAGLSLLMNCATASAVAPTLVVSCQSIGAPGFYEVESPIVTNVVGPCIDITASGVTLSLQSTITGDGTHGIGIHIEHGAAGTIIRGNTVKELPNSGANVTGFDVGVEDSQGGSVLGDFHVNNNHTSGLVLDGASGEMCDDLHADSNGHDGIHIMSTTGARVNFSEAKSNGTFGVWIENSSQVLLDNLTASANGTTNIEFGTPTGGGTSSSNIVDDVGVGNSMFGVVFEKGSTGNRVTQTGVGAMLSADTVDDALDKNGGCKKNLWFNNFFSKSSPNCIH
jgi:hypothetical protein